MNFISLLEIDLLQLLLIAILSCLRDLRSQLFQLQRVSRFHPELGPLVILLSLEQLELQVFHLFLLRFEVLTEIR